MQHENTKTRKNTLENTRQLRTRTINTGPKRIAHTPAIVAAPMVVAVERAIRRRTRSASESGIAGAGARQRITGAIA